MAAREGWRHIEVTARRTVIDYAHILKDLADVHFAVAEKIILVQDNLNTHCKASLYKAFDPAGARRLIETNITQKQTARVKLRHLYPAI